MVFDSSSDRLIMMYVTCDSVKQAEDIAAHLMGKKLCGCVNIYPEMQPMFFWPPKSGKIDKSKEVVLIVKSVESKLKSIEEEIKKVHTYDIPCIITIPTIAVNDEYYNWLIGEME